MGLRLWGEEAGCFLSPMLFFHFKSFPSWCYYFAGWYLQGIDDCVGKKVWGEEIYENSWGNIWHKKPFKAVAGQMQENSLQWSHRWYLCPQKLHFIHSINPSFCKDCRASAVPLATRYTSNVIVRWPDRMLLEKKHFYHALSDIGHSHNFSQVDSLAHLWGKSLQFTW